MLDKTRNLSSKVRDEHNPSQETTGAVQGTGVRLGGQKTKDCL